MTKLLMPLHRYLSDPEGSLPILKRLLSENFRRYRYKYAISFVLMAIVAGTTSASAWIMRDVINEIFIARNAAMVAPIAVAVMAIYMAKGFATYGNQVMLGRIGNNVIAQMQKRLFSHILTLGLDFYKKHPTAHLTTRISYNAQAAREVLNTLVMGFGRDFFSLIGLTFVMVAMDPIMSLVALVIMPLAMLGLGKLIRKIRDIAKSEFKSLAEVIARTQETGQGIQVVKAFNLEPRMRAAAHLAIENVEQRANKIISVTSRTAPLMETLGGFAVALVISYGGFRVITQGYDAGSFFAFLTALLMAYEPARRLARLNISLVHGAVMVKMIYELLDTRPSLSEGPDAKPLRVTRGHVKLDNVSFDYGGGVPALENVTLEARPGQVTALVGPSGAGKTTIFSLLERFYDPQAGTVSIDGQSVDSVTFTSLRNAMALVGQETFLFDGTVAENIAMGRPEASREEIVAAAKAANADDFISAMPQQYDTPVGEGGGLLSGGQRQRLAIARAMLRDAPILLLDEATASLDAESEAKVQEALDRLMAGRTTIVIAHRLSTVRNADRIYVMDAGRVVESGSHEKLIAVGGLYSKLHALQFAA